MKETKNLYKERLIFKCVHDVHRHFKSEMSPFHILQEKNCFPYGCIYFQWKCRLLAKKKTCFRNFTFVGKECFNCKYFYEEKIHQYPEPVRSIEKHKKFIDDYEQFDEWVTQLKQKRVLCEGYVHEVKPEIVLENKGKALRPFLRGILVEFDEGFIENIHFKDRFYLSISTITQNKLQIRKGDHIEFMASLLLDRGRFKFIKSGRFEFYGRGEAPPIKKYDLVLALNSATIQSGQPPKCVKCRMGILADITDTKTGPRRSIVCMQGVPDYKHCHYHIYKNNSGLDETCANSQWHGIRCNQTL